MALDHDTGIYNVQGTLLLWLQTQLIANKPPTVAAVVLRVEEPQESIDNDNCPLWSAHFLGFNDDPIAVQGQYVSGSQYGARRHGLLEVSCWTTRNDKNWREQIYQMQDAVTASVQALRSTGSAIKVRDFYQSSTNPPELGYKVVIGTVETRQPPVDPNPSIERKRVLIAFHWVERK